MPQVVLLLCWRTFTVVQTSALHTHRTRFSTPVFQPKWIFDILFSSDTERGAALAKVRVLLVNYDPILVSPDLKFEELQRAPPS
jgi:hypothetical protein